MNQEREPQSTNSNLHIIVLSVLFPCLNQAKTYNIPLDSPCISQHGYDSVPLYPNQSVSLSSNRPTLIPWQPCEIVVIIIWSRTVRVCTVHPKGGGGWNTGPWLASYLSRDPNNALWLASYCSSHFPFLSLYLGPIQLIQITNLFQRFFW